MISKVKQSAIISGAALALSFVQPVVIAADGDGWQFSTSPFLWGSGIDGDYRIGDQSVNVDIGFDDILDATEMGFQTYLELRKEKFGFYVNPAYIKLSADGEVGNGNLKFEQDFWMIDAGGFYNLVQTTSTRPFTLDVYAGLRYWNIDSDFDFESAAGVHTTFGATFEVIDPVIGLRMQQYFTEKWSIGLRTDIGGFGISEGDTSDLSWQAMALVGYDINEKFTVFAGYRALGMEGEEEGDRGVQREIDITMHGALLGLQIKW